MSQSSPHKTLIMKFGGTSVGSIEAMAQVIEIVQQGKREWPRLVVVASALNGITNLLLDCANRSALGDRDAYRPAAEEMTARHYAMIDTFVTDPARGALVKKEIDRLVDMQKLEDTLMREGVAKFADPHKALLALIAEKRAALATAT